MIPRTWRDSIQNHHTFAIKAVTLLNINLLHSLRLTRVWLSKCKMGAEFIPKQHSNRCSVVYVIVSVTIQNIVADVVEKILGHQYARLSLGCAISFRRILTCLPWRPLVEAIAGRNILIKWHRRINLWSAGDVTLCHLERNRFIIWPFNAETDAWGRYNGYD